MIRPFKSIVNEKTMSPAVTAAKGKAYEHLVTSWAGVSAKFYKDNPYGTRKEHDAFLNHVDHKHMVDQHVKRDPNHPISILHKHSPDEAYNVSLQAKDFAHKLVRKFSGKVPVVTGNKKNLGDKNDPHNTADVSVTLARSANKQAISKKATSKGGGEKRGSAWEAEKRKREKGEGWDSYKPVNEQLLPEAPNPNFSSGDSRKNVKTHEIELSLKNEKSPGREKMRSHGLTAIGKLVDKAHNIMGNKNNLSGEMAKLHDSQTKEASSAWLKHEKTLKGFFGEPGGKGKDYSAGGAKSKSVSWNYVKDAKGKNTGIALSHGATSMLRDHAKANPDSPAAKAYGEMSKLSQKHASDMVGLVHKHMEPIFKSGKGGISTVQHVAQSHIYHGIHNTEGQRLSVTGYNDKKSGPQSSFYDPQSSIHNYVSSTKKTGMPLGRSGNNIHIGGNEGKRVMSLDRRYRGPTIYAAWNVNKAVGKQSK